MLFSSPLFLFLFLPFVLIINMLLPKKLSNVFLLVMSLIFYAWGERVYFGLMILSTVLNFLLGIAIDKFRTKSKVILALGVLVNLSFLIYFKYANFIIENINVLFKLFHFEYQTSIIQNLSLPIGISFYTFHCLSYLIDVYRKNTLPQKNLIDLGLYISFFPQLIAGPIVRYHNIESQLKVRIVTKDDYLIGTERFIIGLAKKLILANSFAYIADYIFALPNVQISTMLAWIGILSYSMQIYFDFSGYSDMAIGLARILGFQFLENFNYPYISKSIKEFWRRWHISLSSWFRDYLYIPLGGSKVQKTRGYINILIVFFITGLWHGASWNFIIWGIFYGVFLIMERAFLEKILLKMPNVITHFYTLILTVTAWVFFRSTDLTQSLNFIKKMYIFDSNSTASESHINYLLNYEFYIIFILGVLFCTPIVKIISEKIHNKVNSITYAYYIFLFIIFIISLTYLAAGTYNPFIYFRF